MNKIFKIIPGYKNYFINEDGIILSTKRKTKRYLKPTKNKTGYLCVGLIKNRIEKKYKVHQLVAVTFLDHTINGMILIVDHIDNNKLNNNVNNLQLISQHENTLKKSSKGTSKFVGVSYITRDKKWNARLTINGVYKSLGNFNTEIEAHLSHNRALKQIRI